MIEPSASKTHLASQSPIVHGHCPDSVINAIRERHFRRRDGDTSDDGNRIALVLEGGGMRATCAAGGAFAMGHLGLSSVFDDVYATSAAVMNASYFLTGQEDMGITIYFDDLTGDRFCKLSRFWKILDVDYAVNEVVKKRKPLDLARLLASPTRLHVALMNQRTGEFSNRVVKGTEDEALRLLEAALSIPVFYGRTVAIEGQRLMDGGLRQPFPIRAALDDGATHVLVMLTQPYDFHHPPSMAWQRGMFQLLCSRGRSDVYRAFRDAHLVSRELRDFALGRTAPPGSGAAIATLCSREEPFVTTMTRDRDRLVAAATAYGRMTLEAFGVSPGDWALGPRDALSWE